MNVWLNRPTAIEMQTKKKRIKQEYTGGEYELTDATGIALAVLLFFIVGFFATAYLLVRAFL